MAPVLTMTQRNDNAGIAQLVERNLAKVEVPAPNIKNGECIYAFAVLVRMVARTKDLFWFTMLKYNGAIAKRLCRGLQSRLDQFDSGSRLQFFEWILSKIHLF